MQKTLSPDANARARNVFEMFSENVHRVPERRAVKSAHIELTYAELGRLAASIAEDLPEDISGQGVLFYLPNSAAFVAAYYSVLSRKGIPIPLNTATPSTAVAATAQKVHAALLVTDQPGLWDGPELIVSDLLAPERLRQTNLPATPEPVSELNPDDDAVHLFSGGTTGTPKRVRHTHRSIMAVVDRMEWCWPTEDGDVWLAIAPFSHVWGLVMGVLCPQINGCTLILPEKYHPTLILDLMEGEKVSVFGGGPPAIYQGLMAEESFSKRDFSRLRVCPGGGAPFPLDVHERWMKYTGCRIVEAFGMSEVAPISVNSDSHGPRIGSVGRPAPDTQIEIVDVETGTRQMPAGEHGEIRIKGPQSMLGYVDNPEETAQTMRDGWIYSGDIGVMDADGYLTITDRKKDLIIHKGYNVFPRELEETLISHAAVDGVGVVGVPDERAGENIIAFVTVSSPIEEKTLRDHCAKNLAAYKMPTEIRIVDELPLTMARKLDRIKLRQIALARG